VQADTRLFSSGVEPEHFRTPAAEARAAGRRPVAGYVGVLDERLDLALIDDLARSLPGWDIKMYGPVAKIDPASLPQRTNISYEGFTPYAALPEAMASLDVATGTQSPLRWPRRCSPPTKPCRSRPKPRPQPEPEPGDKQPA
jgi:hypothetical protein